MSIKSADYGISTSNMLKRLRCRSTVMPAGQIFLLPEQRDEWEDRLLLLGMLLGSLCACVQPPEAAPPRTAPAPAPAPARPGSRAASWRPLGQYQGRRAKSCWSCHQTIGRGIAVLLAIRQRAFVAERSMCGSARGVAESYCAEHPADRPSRHLGRLIDKPSDDRARHFSGWIPDARVIVTRQRIRPIGFQAHSLADELGGG